MKFRKVNVREAEFFPAPSRRIAELISREACGAQGVTFRVVDLQPRSEASTRHPHAHLEWEEVIYVLWGEGEAWVEGRLYPFEAGDVLLLPARTRHALRNTTSEPVRLLCFFPHPAIEESRAEFDEIEIPSRSCGGGMVW